MGGPWLLHYFLSQPSLRNISVGLGVSNADLPLEGPEAVLLRRRHLPHRTLSSAQNVVPGLGGEHLDAGVLGEVVWQINIEPHLGRALSPVLTGHERVGLGLDHLLDSLVLALE